MQNATRETRQQPARDGTAVRRRSELHHLKAVQASPALSKSNLEPRAEARIGIAKSLCLRFASAAALLVLPQTLTAGSSHDSV
jgi:hypothetical protein